MEHTAEAPAPDVHVHAAARARGSTLAHARWPLLLLLSAGGLAALTLRQSPKYLQQRHFGDDAEYLLAAESFERHASPEYQAGDDFALLMSLPRHFRNSLLKKYRTDPPAGYYVGRHGARIGWHFFTYPAAVAPIKAYLDARGRGGEAFQATNLLWFCAALLSMLQLWRTPRLWLVLLPLSFLTPALWFLPLAHTEAFVFSLGLLALTCYLSGRTLLAIAWTALAATQFQPLSLCALALCADEIARVLGAEPGPLRLATLRKHGLRIGTSVALAAIVFIPGAFYDHYFGTPSLVTREGFAAGHLMSLHKFGSLFFDLNTGLLVYLPGVLLLLCWSALSAGRRCLRERSLRPMLPLAVVLAALYATTTARIWNYNTQGIARYSLYLTPQLLLVIALELRAQPRVRWPLALSCACALGLQLAVHATFGLFDYRGNNNLHHNQIASYVLEHWPQLYDPPPEIFCSRTLHRRCWLDLDSGYVTREYLPALWLSASGRPRKALIDPCHPEATLRAFAFSSAEAARVRAAASDCRSSAPRYVNFL